MTPKCTNTYFEHLKASSTTKDVISKRQVAIERSHLVVLNLRLERSHIVMNPCSDEEDKHLKIYKNKSLIPYTFVLVLILPHPHLFTST